MVRPSVHPSICPSVMLRSDNATNVDYDDHDYYNDYYYDDDDEDNNNNNNYYYYLYYYDYNKGVTRTKASDHFKERCSSSVVVVAVASS